MPIGVIVNSSAVFVGGILGALLGNRIPERLRTALPLAFGAASMSMGITYILKLKILPVVVLALIVGTAIGELIYFEKGIEKLARAARGPVERLFGSKKGAAQEGVEESTAFMEKFVAIFILFCASGTGIFGALNEGMTGDYSVLVTKSILDFFTSGIFAATLGFLVATIAIPQFAVLLALFFSAAVILPMTTPEMIANFTACGGMIMLATGLRISGIKSFPIANMLPALVLVMPITHLWMTYL